MSPALLLFAALLLLEIARRLACDRPVRTPFLAIAFSVSCEAVQA